MVSTSLRNYSVPLLHPSPHSIFIITLKAGLEKEMAPHSSTLAWKIPWMEEPGRLQSTGSQSRTRLSNFTHSHLTPVDQYSVSPRLERAVAPYSSTLAWRMLWKEEPGRLQSMGSLGVRTRLSDFTFTFHFPVLEKEMTTHSSILAWRIPGTGEPGGLLSLGSHRVRHN